MSSLTAHIPLGIQASDLAPGDFRSAEFDWTGLNVCFVETAQHPRFETGYCALWDEFGSRNEMEPRHVIAQRMAWRPSRPIDGHAMLYQMVVVTQHNELAAVCDQTAIVDLNTPDAPVVTHLSHLLVAPRFRGSGLSGWMRALPIRTARECLVRAGQPLRPITLVAEVEHLDPHLPERAIRLMSFQRVGFLKIDDRAVNYLQPDFRPPEQIDESGRLFPVPLSLVIRRVGQEHDRRIDGREVRRIVEALYFMYGQSFRQQDMRPNYESLAHYPADDAQVDLLLPMQQPPSTST